MIISRLILIISFLLEVGCRGYFLGHALEFKWTPVFLKDFDVRKPKNIYIIINYKNPDSVCHSKAEKSEFCKKITIYSIKKKFLTKLQK